MLSFGSIKSAFRLFCKYIIHYLKAKNKQGHGIHSPFLYEFVKKVVAAKTSDMREIEDLRNHFKQSNKKIQVVDIGAGSLLTNSQMRSEKFIVNNSTQKKVNRFLYRMALFVKPDYIVELGTSFGFSTMYMAKSGCKKIYTVEGDPEIATVAKQNFAKLKNNNIIPIQKTFSEALPEMVDNWYGKGMFFIDGNHTCQATLNYFDYVIKHLPGDGVLIFDDIYWSKGMTTAWEEIINSPMVPLSVDLFHVGVVFVKKMLYKQHYLINF